MDLNHVSTLMFTPGHVARRFDKAMQSGADGVILDLEDAVAPADKQLAREQVYTWLSMQPVSRPAGHPLVAVRLNGMQTPFFEADHEALLQACRAGHGPDLVVLPKVESPAMLNALAAQWHDLPEPSPGLVALIETALGLEQVLSIAQFGPPLVAMGFGGADLAADLSCAFAWEPLLYARGRMVHAAAMGGIALWDVPYLQLDDPAGLAAETRRVQQLGFTGKFAIHPCQTEVIRRSFLPSAEERTAAQKIVESFARNAGGAYLVAGHMVDAPVVAAARRMLARKPIAEPPCS